MKQNKVTRQYRLSPEIVKRLEAEAFVSGKSMTNILEEALLLYFDKDRQFEEMADKFLERFDDKYKNFMTRVRLASRSADVNSQIQLELWNMSMLQKKFTKDDFVMSEDMESPVMRKAKEGVKERIERFKLAKDSRDNA